MRTTLNQVETAFNDWRATRSKRGPIPQELATQVLGLLGQHSKSEITRRLGINHGMLNRWTGKQPADDTFITLSTDVTEPVTSTNNQSLDISIRLTSGAQLTLSGSEFKAAAFISELQQRGAL